jgi:PAS domain S-box-containing protein
MPMRLIIVDDDSSMLTALSGVVETRLPGVVIDTETSGHAALERIAEIDYDAIVSDIKMPGMDGLELMNRVLKIRPTTPTLLVTGHGDHDLGVKALNAGAYAFIQKPIDRDFFLAWLKRAIQLRQLSRTVEQQNQQLERMVQSRTEELEQRNQDLKAIIAEQAESAEALRKSEHVQGVLYRFTDTLHRAASLTQVCDSALDSILSALRCERASILLSDDAGVLRFAGWRGLSDGYRNAVEGHSPWKPGEATPQPVCIEDLDTADMPEALKAIVKAERIRALAFIPLVVNGTLIGKFMTYYDTPHVFTDEELELALTIARHAGLGVQRKRAEEQLRENAERLWLATQTSKVGIWDWDIAANRVSWTDSLYSIHGVKREEFNGELQGFVSLVHPDDRDVVSNAVERSLNEDAPYELEFRAVKPDGQVIWLFTNAVVLRSGETPVRMLGATLDITERKGAEEQLQNSERRLRELIEALPAAVYTTDAEGRITMFNEAAVQFSGRVPQLGTDSWCVSWKLFRPDGTPWAHDQCPMAMTLKEGRPIHGYEAIAERPDGTRVNFLPYPTPLRDTTGKLVGAVNMLVDITERKRAEETQARLAAIVDSSDDAIISKDLDGRVTSWNHGAERLFGYTAEQMIGKPISVIIPLDRQGEEQTILSRIAQDERVEHYETVRRRKDGTHLHVSLTVSPVKDSQGRVIGASKIARDITERKRLEEIFQESERHFSQEIHGPR